MKKAIFALGCFWKPEENFSKLNGIINTEVGYCGGNVDKTTYEDVCTGETEHAEVVKMEFDLFHLEYILIYPLIIIQLYCLNNYSSTICIAYLIFLFSALSLL